MKEHPIIFNTDNVKAILEGRQTQTRRVIRGLGSLPNRWRLYVDGNGWLSGIKPDDFNGWFFAHNDKGKKIKCPYGLVGDRLWVRETINLGYDNQDLPIYKAGLSNGEIIELEKSEHWTGWKPSIHMLRWASRITLEITGVRVERLQDITPEDIIAEGCSKTKPFHSLLWNFIVLWNPINDKRGYGWDTNPWVWVIRFKNLT
jgi:hypothetical protein